MSHLPVLVSPPPSALRPLRPSILPLLSNSSSIWGHTVAAPSQSQVWPETRDAWPSIASKHAYSPSGLPDSSTDAEKNALQGDVLCEDPVPEKLNDDSRRRHVGAIGEGRRERAKTQYLDVSNPILGNPLRVIRSFPPLGRRFCHVLDVSLVSVFSVVLSSPRNLLDFNSIPLSRTARIDPFLPSERLSRH